MASNSNDAHAHFCAGAALVGKKKYREALEKFDQARELFGRTAVGELEVLTAICLEKLGEQPTQAKSCLHVAREALGDKRVDELLAIHRRPSLIGRILESFVPLAPPFS